MKELFKVNDKTEEIIKAEYSSNLTRKPSLLITTNKRVVIIDLRDIKE